MDIEQEVVKRGPGRPPLRTETNRPPVEDHKARAAARLAEIRAAQGDSGVDLNDKFYIDPKTIPDGWSYEWKRWSVFNQEDPKYFSAMKRSGWVPVPVSRHPELVYPGYDGEHIINEGLILVERPKVLTDEAHARDLMEARSVVRAKEAQMSGERNAMGAPQQKLAHSRHIGPLDVPVV